jgi:hypothetical protein
MERSLAELRDIHLPPPPGGGPAIDDRLMWIALSLAVAATLWLIGRYRRRALRAALKEVDAAADAFRQDGDASGLSRRLSRVLRRHAIVRFPQTAGLIGRDWLTFLDAHGPSGFVEGQGAVLAEYPYRPSAKHPIDGESLVTLVKRWLRSNP